MLDKKKLVNYLECDIIKDLTVEQVEKMLRERRMVFSPAKDEVVEYFKFEPFAYTFYQLFDKTGIIPTQKEFIDAYLEKAKVKYPIIYNNHYESLTARLKRSYPAYCRDFHFFIKCKESGLFENVFYNIYVDVEDGIDLIVTRGGQRFGVHLFTNSKSAEYWRARKNFRHKKVDDSLWDIIPVDLTVFKEDGYRVGQHYLYGNIQLNELVDKIDDIINVGRLG